jgi:hypothetical protein
MREIVFFYLSRPLSFFLCLSLFLLVSTLSVRPFLLTRSRYSCSLHPQPNLLATAGVALTAWAARNLLILADSVAALSFEALKVRLPLSSLSLSLSSLSFSLSLFCSLFLWTIGHRFPYSLTVHPL